MPTPSGLGSANASAAQFFGRFGQFFIAENMGFSFNLFHGDTASFRPPDWRIQLTPEINVNYLAAQENGVVNFDVRKGTTRLDAHLGLQEGFVEVKLKDLSNQYDFVSLRMGVQCFNSDFRGFIFSDQEPGIRLYGNLDSNRYQFNLAYFAMLEKDTNSGLNTMSYRNQQVMIANFTGRILSSRATRFRPVSITTKTIPRFSTTPIIFWCVRRRLVWWFRIRSGLITMG